MYSILQKTVKWVYFVFGEVKSATIVSDHDYWSPARSSDDEFTRARWPGMAYHQRFAHRCWWPPVVGLLLWLPRRLVRSHLIVVEAAGCWSPPLLVQSLVQKLEGWKGKLYLPFRHFIQEQKQESHAYIWEAPTLIGCDSFNLNTTCKAKAVSLKSDYQRHCGMR